MQTTLYQVKATFDYDPTPDRAADELAFKTGQIIDVYEDSQEWWQGKVVGTDKVGYFPSNFCEKHTAVAVDVAPAQPPPAKQPEKKAGGGRGGGGRSKGPKQPPNSGTRFGVWSSLTLKYVSMFYIIGGLGTFIWATFETKSVPFLYQMEVRTFSGGDAILAIYSIGFGVGTWLYESKYNMNVGYYIEGSTAPNPKPLYFQGIMYAIFTLPLFFSLTGLIGNLLIILPISLKFVSGYLGEVFVPRAKRASGPKKKDEYDQEPLTTRIIEFVAGKNPEGQLGRFFCIILYIFFNFYTGITAVNTAYKTGVQDDFTYFVHVAKFFGYIMDLNFSLILLPVSRVFISGLYNCATRETISCKAKFFLCLLKIFPVDQAHGAHKMLAWVGFGAAVGHTIAHVINFGPHSATVYGKFGLNIWITGGGLVTIMFLIFPCTHNILKKFHFELFWGTHMLFPLFFILVIMHGCPAQFITPPVPVELCWMGPHYVYPWFVIPGSIFIFERGMRYYLQNQKASLLAFVRMGDIGVETTVLQLSCQKIGAFGPEYKEGQYSFINCPPISSFEWHPFTISSCPQQADVTFHIRIIKGGWTQKLLHTLEQYSTKTEPLTKLSHNKAGLKGMETKPGREYHSDGKRLIRIYGPHSAPTQHLTKYNEAFIVTSGIGVTPLNSCMKSVVLHKWKFDSGVIKPSRVHFFWVTQHAEIQRFRWFIRTVKDVSDTLADILEKNFSGGEIKTQDPLTKFVFQFHVFLTRIKDEVNQSEGAKIKEFLGAVSGPKREFERATKAYDNAVNAGNRARAAASAATSNSARTQAQQEEKNAAQQLKNTEEIMEKKRAAYTAVYQRFWGSEPRDLKGVKTGLAQFTEQEFYQKLCNATDKMPDEVFPVCSNAAFQEQAIVKIHAGRPKWTPFFDEINKVSPFEDIGVCFCGNPFIGKALEKNCSNFTKQNRNTRKKLTWHLHQEVF